MYTFLFRFSTPALHCYSGVFVDPLLHGLALCLHYYYDCYWRFMTSDNVLNHYYENTHTHNKYNMYTYIIMMVYNVIEREHERYGVIFSFFYFCDKWSAPTWVFVHTVFRNSRKSPMFLYTIHFITTLSTSYKKKTFIICNHQYYFEVYPRVKVYIINKQKKK